MAAILGETKIFEDRDGYSAEIPSGSNILSKLLCLARFSRYKLFLCFAIFAKNSTIQNGRQFWRGKIFLKIAMASRRNGSNSHGFQDISIFVFSLFGKFVRLINH